MSISSISFMRQPLRASPQILQFRVCVGIIELICHVAPPLRAAYAEGGSLFYESDAASGRYEDR